MPRPQPHGAHTAELHPRTQALALQTVDQVTSLSMTLQAYLALEKLITPEYAADIHEHVPPSREQLGALLRTINDEMQRQVNQLSDTTTVLQTVLGDNTGSR